VIVGLAPGSWNGPRSLAHLRQLRVGQRQGPQPEVRSRVRDRAEDVLDGVDALEPI
jgi:hypothetical protein